MAQVCLCANIFFEHMEALVDDANAFELEWAMVASAKGMEIHLVGPQGPYTMVHPKSIKHARTLPEGPQWWELIVEEMTRFTSGDRPTLVARARAVAQRLQEKIYRLQTEFKIKKKRDTNELDKLKVRTCLSGQHWTGIELARAAV